MPLYHQEYFVNERTKEASLLNRGMSNPTIVMALERRSNFIIILYIAQYLVVHGDIQGQTPQILNL